MRILFTNQFCLNEEDKIVYEFEKDKLKITHKGISETLNFEGLPNGKLELYNEKTNERLIKHKTEIDYLISAEKKNGTLHLELLNYIPENATMEERFPVEIHYTEYTPTLFGKERLELIAKQQEEYNKKNKEEREKLIQAEIDRLEGR